MEDVEGIGFYIPSATNTKDVTTGLADDDVTPSVVDTGAEADDLPEQIVEPTMGEGVADTLNADIEEVEIPENVDQEKKKSKKRKNNNGTERRDADTGEPSEPKNKMRKEERATKRARWAERKARKAAEKVAKEEEADDNVQEVDEEKVHADVRPTGFER
ncbi:hypothetical protein LIER_28812 [Lithospermum erythrorhizon]|uniref:Uncharacterized protein n=1 Tax=Lithospermum erythrorhizon TaxID=34254 RepID=A0AAV3RI29_LITER